MPLTKRSIIIDNIIESLDVPDSAYEAAERRYKDLGTWLHDQGKASIAPFSPHVFAQGSFRLGTVTRPWKREDYDLDLACKLQQGLTKSNHTQEQLKRLVGSDLEKYRKERGIQDKLEEKHRCWRLNYQDSLQFHMDVVPGIPEDEERRQILRESIIKAGTAEALANDVAKLAMAITDDRHPGYVVITPFWQISNQEGYALWFEYRMRQARELLESRAAMAKVSKVDDLPAYRWKTPLQRCIQILKRHRDIVFEKNPNDKPISVIITTLAARAYNGEIDLESAMNTILSNMDSFVNPTAPRVPNPVNPKEDFADKWPNDPNLEDNFRIWLDKAKKDFNVLRQDVDIKTLTEIVLQKFGVSLDESKLRKSGALLEKAAAITSGAAFTSSNGTIGSSGVKNQPHKFYG
jgi:hypothetical protein